MLSEKGIRIQVLSGGKEVMVAKDGCLGENLDELRLQCLVQRQEPMPICFVADGKKNTVPMRPRFSDQTGVLFAKRVPVRQIYGGGTTEPATNNIRFAISVPTGNVEIWKLAILIQDGVFFLAEQKTHEAQWFLNKNNEAVCLDSYFANRPQLMELLKPVMKREQLLPVSEYTPPPQIKADNLPKNQGILVFWDLPGQWGLITIDDKSTVARVHWRELPLNMNGGLRKLEVGQIVKYGTLRELPQSSRSTTVNLEAQQVTPVL